MKSKMWVRFIYVASNLILDAVISGCNTMMTMPDSKLQEAASEIVGKQIVSISNVFNNQDMSYFDARASDGTNYSCSLQVVFGVMWYQHQKCDKK